MNLNPQRHPSREQTAVNDVIYRRDSRQMAMGNLSIQ